MKTQILKYTDCILNCCVERVLSLVLRPKGRTIRVLRGIFVSQREDVTGGRRKLRNEEVHAFYISSVITVIT